MFSLLNTVIKIGFQTTVVVVSGTATYAYLTKPTNESFNNAFTKDKSFIKRSVINGVLDYVVKPSFEDYVFFKIATLPGLPGEKDLTFIGGNNKWYPLNE
jgi:hypothetical protein